MIQPTFSPSSEQIQATSQKVSLLCHKIDVEIKFLDEIIAQLELDLQTSKLSQYYSERAKSGHHIHSLFLT